MTGKEESSDAVESKLLKKSRVLWLFCSWLTKPRGGADNSCGGKAQLPSSPAAPHSHTRDVGLLECHWKAFSLSMGPPRSCSLGESWVHSV